MQTRIRNSARYVILLGAHWRAHTHPVHGVEFIGTIQRGMHIGAIGRGPDGEYVCASHGRLDPLVRRKVDAALPPP